MSNRNEDWKNSNFKATFSNKNEEQDEIASLKASREKENYYNLNIATFTFGGRQNNINNLLSEHKNLENLNSNNYKKPNTNIRGNLSTSKDKEKENIEFESNLNYYSKNQISNPVNKLTNNNYINDGNSNISANYVNNNSIISNNILNTNNSNDVSANITVINNAHNTSNLSNLNSTATRIINTNINGPIMVNRIGDHNSFLGVVIHALWNIKFFRNFIVNELNTSNEKESKNKLFYYLKSIFNKYERNKILDINKLRCALAETFQNRRKFLLDQPDNPVDCYFAFINAIHSYHIQTSLSEIKDTNCYNKCLAHKYLWIDLCRVDGCECQATSKRLFSYHNYIFDIPLEKIFNLTNNINLIEMSKSFKLKSINTKNQNFANELNNISTTVNNLTDLKGKLFLYYKLLFNQLKTDCPGKGATCEINKTNRAFFLTNIPYNLSFSLVNPKKYGKILSHLEILKALILIPKILDLSILFDYSSKQKVFYEFFGAFLMKPSKAYSCFFRQNAGNNNINNENINNWTYYDCGKIISNPQEQSQNISFGNWFDLISHCLASGEYPIMLFYQIQQKYIENEKEISNEEIQILERYAKSADNLNSIVNYKFRPSEDIIKSEPSSNSSSLHLNNNHESSNLKNGSKGSKSSSSISTSRNTSNNNSNSRMETVEYNCIYCFSKNRMDNMICYKCGQNNEAVVEDIIKKRHLNNNYINIANFNLNINTDDKVSFRTKENPNNERVNINNNLNKNDNLEYSVKSNNNKNTEDNSNNNYNNNFIQNKDGRSDRDRESIKHSSLKKHSEGIQPQIKNNNSKNPFQVSNEKERINNINTINHEEDFKTKNMNMPKQISSKNNINVNTKNNKNNINPKDLHYSNERTSQNILSNKEYLNSPPSNVNRSNSKRNLNTQNQNTNNTNNNLINNPVLISENLKMKKMETITTSSYVSTPVFNKEKENQKINEKEKTRLIEDRLKPFEEKDKRKKIDNFYTPNNQIQDKNINKQPILIEKKNNYITNPKNQYEHWICESCSSVNKNNSNQCGECKRSYHSSIKESFNRNDSSNMMSEHFRETDSFSANNQETFGNRNSKNNPSYINQVQINLNNVNNKKNQSLEKKVNQNVIISSPSEKKLINNYFSEKNESIKRNNCACHSHYEESLVRNNHCKLCGRYIEYNPPHNNYNSHQNQQITYLDNILKKKGYDLDFNPKINMKKGYEKDKPVTLHENNKKKDLEKMKSPTSNNIKNKTGQGPQNHNKYEDDRIIQNYNNNNNNPSIKPSSKEKEAKEKELSKQIRMSSTNKRNKIELNKFKK